MPPAIRTAPRRATRRQPLSRPSRRRSLRPLEQIPVWSDAADRSGGPDDGSGISSGLTDLLGGLNAEQRRAVTHGEGPLLVVAGAGTGKTQVVTRRIAWLIATRRARPSEILALTFTDKAAAEMQVRVDQLVPYGYTDTAISTFHAFGDRLIREYALELGLPPDVRVLARPEVVIFLRERLFEFELERYRPLADPTRFLGALATHFSRLKDEDIDPAAYLAHADREVGRAGLMAELAARMERPTTPVSWPRQRPSGCPRARAGPGLCSLPGPHGGRTGFIDFGDQVALALRLSASVGRRPERGSQAGSGTSSWTSSRTPTGRRRSWSSWSPEPRRNVTVVGDDDQSIYRFRGAAISNMLELPRSYRRRRAPSSCAGTTAPGRPSSTRAIGSSGSTTRIGWRSGPGSTSGCARSGGADRAAPPPSATRHSPAERTRPTGSPPDRRRIHAGARRATTRCWSGRTPRPTRSCAASTWPACRGASRGARGSTPGPRSACCWRSCGPWRISARVSTSTPWRRRSCTASVART